MKKIICLFVFLLHLASAAQNFHRNYSSHYIVDSAKLRSVVHGGAIYLCYTEDSTSGSAAKVLALLKINAAGNVIWKRHYSLSGGIPEPVKLLADSGSVFIGGNFQQNSFIAKVDTATGAPQYFWRYRNSSFPNSNSRIFDMCFAWPGQIMAVGKQSIGTNWFLIYMLRTVASDGFPLTNAHSQLNTDVWAHGVTFFNGKVYLAGEYQQRPMLAKLALSNGSLVPAGSSYFTQGFTQPSAFTAIESRNGRIVCMGRVNGAVSPNYIFNVDTALIGTFGTIGGTLFGNASSLQDLIIEGTNVRASGIFGGKPGVISFTNNLNISSPVTYSHNAVGTVIEHWNNRMFVGSFRDGSSSSMALVKGDVNGLTECSSYTSAPGTQLSGNCSVLGMSVISQGQVIALYPASYTVGLSEGDLCPLTSVSENEAEAKLRVSRMNEGFEIFSPATIESVTVHDLCGRLVFKREPSSQAVFVDLSDAPQGIYLLKVVTQGRPYYMKLQR